MPPEPLPWDRKDFFKERKYERPEPYHNQNINHHHHHHHHHHPHPTGGGGGGGGGGYGGGIGGFGGGPRWREPPHPHPHPYQYASPRWVSDFRYRPPPGYGKQGGRHLYPEESNHGFVPSRPSDRILDDENYRTTGSGKYSRSNRESRGPFGQKDWKAQSWEAIPSPNAPGRPNDTSDQHRSVDDMQTCISSHPHSDSANSQDQSNLKDQHEKSGGVNAFGSSSQRLERENSLGSIDWKPLKWSRSGSLSSRGSGFSHSSSSKSMGVDSNEMNAEVQPSNVTAIQSPSGVVAAAPAAIHETFAAPSEETNSRKKPRLGWGEGLAKYEKKKVEVADDTIIKNESVICSSSSSREPVHLHSSHLAEKSPKVAAFPDCASPATPSSIGYSSSSGLEDKQFVKGENVDNDATNLSPGIVSQTHIEGSTFNLETLDLAQSGHLNSAIDELLQSDDPTLIDSGFVKSTAINKLLVWKSDVLKKLEKTESEIDGLEVELKSLTLIPECSPHPPVSGSLPIDCLSKPAEEQDVMSNITCRPAPLDLGSSEGNDAMKIPDVLVNERAEAKHEDVDSPGSATSKFVEIGSAGKDVSPAEIGNYSECLSNTDIANSESQELRCFSDSLHEDKEGEISAHGDESQPDANCSRTHLDEINLFDDREHKLCELIFASNKECAIRAAGVFNNLLPTDPCKFDISSVVTVSSLESNSMVKEKYLRRKRSQQFKEKCIALKYRVLRHLWKEDIRSLSMRKFHVKSHKRLDVSLRPVHNCFQKHRSSLRSQFTSIAGNLSLEPNTGIVNFISNLLSDSQVKPFRDTLKMPALILDKKEKIVSRFISSNGLVEDPCAVEKERSMINPWTSEEKEIFMDKLAAFGKDFTKIASFLVHKTTADCIEFYYKNHKTDGFKKTKKHPEYAKQRKIYSANNYLVASGKRWRSEANAASLDILGAASAIAANVVDGMEIQRVCTSNYLLGRSSDHKTSRRDNGSLERLSSLDTDKERETVAADVLAGICGSLSSEAMSSCITSAVDPRDGYREWKCQIVGSSSKLPLTPEVMQNADEETCSDESCGEMDPTDWTDEEKSVFIQAVSSYGKDFAMISRYVRTRSRDQCKVFFSKARKCLGLDMICPGSGNVVKHDVNGGCNDTNDACVVETGSVLCCEKLGVVKMEVDLPSLEVKLNAEPVSAVPAKDKPDLNQLEENIRTGDRASEASELLSKNMIDDSQLEDETEQQVNENVVQSVPGDVDVDVQDQGNVPSTGEAGLAVGETCEDANTSGTEVHSRDLEKLTDEHLDSELEGLVSVESSINDGKEKDDVNVIDQGLKSTPHGGLSGNQQIGELESDSALEPGVIPLQQKSIPIPMNSAPQSCAVNCGIPNEGKSSALQVVKNSGGQAHQSPRLEEKLLSSSSLPGTADPSQILRGYPIPASATRKVNGDSSCRSVTLQSIPKSDKNFCHDGHSACDSYLQKCNGVKNQSSIAELPFKFREQSRDSNPSYQSGNPSGIGKPRRNGDVKLFGQILTKPSSQSKSSSSLQQNLDNESQQSKMGNPLNTKFIGDQATGGNLSETKLERSNLLSSKNLPARSYGFWDGSRIQTGYHSLPDSATLLAKYPAAFGNYVMPSSKMEQLPARGVNNGEGNLNGSTVFPAREIGSSNAAADCPSYRNLELQPFALDMKQRQDVVLSEMQRRNGFDRVSGMQPQARGLVGMNVGRAGILVGGQCTGVSDPVAAIKMHYSRRAEQLNGAQNGSIIREEDSWRGKGNIGR